MTPALFLQNVSEDTNFMFNELFDKYGKVVYRQNDQKTVEPLVNKFSKGDTDMFMDCRVQRFIFTLCLCVYSYYFTKCGTKIFFGCR